MELKKGIEAEEPLEESPYIKKAGKKIPIDLEGSKEFILVSDLKRGFEVQLISSSQTMEQLILSALTLKANLIDKPVEGDMNYIG